MYQFINFIVLLLVIFPTLAADIPLPDREQETRARKLFGEIRCMVCQSETIADSKAEIAEDMRANVRQQIASGVSDEQIKSGLAARYGNVILMKPPLKNNTLLLWFGPWLVLSFGAIGAYFYFRSAKPQKQL